MQIDIIGGGYAGCAAALTLIGQGHQIRLWESRSELGGRARRIHSKGVDRSLMPEGRALDNGQHLIAGTYHTLIGLIEGVYKPHRPPWQRLPLALYEGRQDKPWYKPLARFAALNGFLGLLCSDLTLKDKLRILPLLRTLRSECFLNAYPTVSGLKAVHPVLYHRLLEPLCLAILNTPAEKACVRRFLAVLQMVFQNASDSDALFVETDLTSLFPEKVVDKLLLQGHEVYCSSRVKGLRLVEPVRWVLDTSRGRVESDAVILAVAPDQVAYLLEEVPSTPERAAMESWVGSLSYAPIATIYFKARRLPRLSYPMVQLDGQPGQWLFDQDWRADAGLSHNTNRHYAIVISAAYEWLSFSLEARRKNVLDQLERIFFLRPEEISEMVVINEKRATYCVEPGQSPPSKIALGYRLYVAGDYIDPLLPATLEAAVKSGVGAAEMLLASG